MKLFAAWNIWPQGPPSSCDLAKGRGDRSQGRRGSEGPAAWKDVDKASTVAKRPPGDCGGRLTFLYDLPWLPIALGRVQAPPYPGQGQESCPLTSVPRRRLSKDHTRQRRAQAVHRLR